MINKLLRDIVVFSLTAEDACPSYKPFKCDVDKCLYTSETCDNVYHCEDKTDESDCGKVFKYNNSKT